MSLSRYIVAKYGDLVREESMNIAVLTWNDPADETTPVLVATLKSTSRVLTAFPGEYRLQDAMKRLMMIKSYGDLRRVIERSTPYTPFEFTEERASLTDAADLLKYTREFFFQELP